ncbi:MAG TPA: hypothetical protein VFA71_15580, partial [Terriglobales bacterium]|nr:hypothetical protein [Terriglobales bacterium]
MAEEKAPSWKDFFTLLHYAGGLLYVAFAITLIVILREKEWHPQVVRFMARAWHEFLAHMGSTAAGFVSPIAVSIL